MNMNLHLYAGRVDLALILQTIKKAKKDKKVFNDTLEAFKKADTIRFSSIITNEEALILQKLKEKFNYKLVSHGAKEYQKFLNGFAKESGLSLYNGDLKEISKSDMIITLGLKISTERHPKKEELK